MRVLFIAGACPYPPDSGGTMRTYNLLKHLSARHEITLIAPARPGVDMNAAFGGAIARVVAVPVPSRGAAGKARAMLSTSPYIVRAHKNLAMEAAVREALARAEFDLLHCDSISAVQAIPTGADLPKVFGAHNVEAVIWERYVREERRSWMAPAMRSQLAKVTAYEAELSNVFDCCVTVSEEDRDQMRRRYGFSNVCVAANGVDLQRYQPMPESDRRSIVFVGSLDWRPNQDAVRWFVESILPRIRTEMADVSVAVVGRRPPPWMDGLCRKANVSLFADVPDVRTYLAEAAVVVVPLRIGGGSRLKILEAMAAGRCVVSTSIGAEGLGVRDGEHLSVADEPSGFASKTLLLLQSPDSRRALTQAGRALVERDYGWERIAVQMEKAWSSTLGKPRPTSCIVTAP